MPTNTRAQKMTETHTQTYTVCVVVYACAVIIVCVCVCVRAQVLCNLDVLRWELARRLGVGGAEGCVVLFQEAMERNLVWCSQ